MFAAMGYAVKCESKLAEAATSIFDTAGFLPVFQNDVRSARHEIVIVSPFLRKARLAHMLELPTEAIRIGVTATIVTRPESGETAGADSAYSEMLPLFEYIAFAHTQSPE